MEHRTEVKAYRATWSCDKCGYDMKFTGRVQMTHPPHYIHDCTNEDCNNSEALKDVYPMIVHEGVDDDEDGPVAMQRVEVRGHRNED